MILYQNYHFFLISGALLEKFCAFGEKKMQSKEHFWTLSSPPNAPSLRPYYVPTYGAHYLRFT